MKIILDSKRRYYIAGVSIFLIAAALITGMLGCAPPPPPTPIPISDWYDLDGIKDNLGDSYVLMNDLDSSTAGYEELASPTANGGKGWEPIGILGGDASFTGIFEGQGYKIRDLFINRPDQTRTGLFGMIDYEAVVKNLGVVNVTVIGGRLVGGLVGLNDGTISNSYSTGSVTGNDEVGGLVGQHSWGALHNCYSIASVTGENEVGGLVGMNDATTINYSYCMGTISDSYSRGNVTGQSSVGGLVGATDHAIMVEDSYSGGSLTGNTHVDGLVASDEFSNVSNSYSTASVTGSWEVGGLVGHNTGIVSNSFWDIQTSGQSTSDGGTGKNTTGMQDIATFSSVAWDIIGVDDADDRNTGYVWNIVDDQTYPFLSWQP
jgi:hypothetical protein